MPFPFFSLHPLQSNSFTSSCHVLLYFQLFLAWLLSALTKIKSKNLSLEICWRLIENHQHFYEQYTQEERKASKNRYQQTSHFTRHWFSSLSLASSAWERYNFVSFARLIKITAWGLVITENLQIEMREWLSKGCLWNWRNLTKWNKISIFNYFWINLVIIIVWQLLKFYNKNNFIIALKMINCSVLQ